VHPFSHCANICSRSIWSQNTKEREIDAEDGTHKFRTQVLLVDKHETVAKASSLLQLIRQIMGLNQEPFLFRTVQMTD